jgi:serine protease AprX
MIKRYSDTRSRGGSFAWVLLLATLTVSVARSSSKVAPDVERAAGSTTNVIIQFRHAPSGADHQKIQARGGTLRHEWQASHAAAYAVPTEVVSSLAADPAVAYISPDRAVQGSLDYSEETINATIALQAGINGKGIGVAILDSGITTVDDLNGTGKKAASRVVYSENFIDSSADTSDQYGHGTHVAGVVAGNGVDSTGGRYTYTFHGVAPNVQIINLRVLDKNGAGTDSGVIEAIHRAISLKSKYNIRVMNLSLGRRVFESYTQDPLCQAVEAAWNAGIVVVVAAGNDGRDDTFHTSGYGMINAPETIPM